MRGNYKHGMRYSRLYNIWRSMKQRCTNPKTVNYHNYGGRGIKVCEEWSSRFMSFRDWAMENGYSDTLSIDRINSNGNYEPSNCRWVSYKAQNNNRRSNKFLELDGQKHTIAEWADITGIKLATIWARLNSGWSVKDALTIKPNCKEVG